MALHRHQGVQYRAFLESVELLGAGPGGVWRLNIKPMEHVLEVVSLPTRRQFLVWFSTSAAVAPQAILVGLMHRSLFLQLSLGGVSDQKW